MRTAAARSVVDGGAAHASADPWPRLLPAASAVARAEVETLICSRQAVFIFDTLSDQLAELIRARHPASLSAEETALRVEEHLADIPYSRYGTWVHYPWSLRLVHVLPQAELAELRRSSNREQLGLPQWPRTKPARIGMVGPAVAHAAAVAATMGDAGDELRLADAAPLALSDVSRLRSGLHNVGISRAVLAAREVLEMDPYARVQLFAEELNAANLPTFLDGDAPLNLLIVECEDATLKARLLDAARDRAIPVIEPGGRGIPG